MECIKEKQSGSRTLYTEVRRLVRSNLLLTSLTVLVCVLAYGFFATRYTYHTDSLEMAAYEGVYLIGAGRFVAPALHCLTNIMAFSPFWQTVIFCVILLLAGFVYAVLIRRESGNLLPDGALFAFIASFVSAPLMASQLMFPNINIGLSFLLVPLALWYVDPFSSAPSFKRFLIGVLIMTPAIDMYESFAPVFLVCVCFMLLLRFCFRRDNGKNGREYVLFLLTRGVYIIGILACAILLDFTISKIICRIFTGTFDFYYVGTTYSHWSDTTSSFVTSLKKLFCYLVIDLFLTPAENLWAFLYTGSLAVLFVLIAAVAIKNAKKNGVIKTIVGVLCFFGMFASTKALDFILYKPALLRQMQPVLIFTPFVIALAVFYLCKLKLKPIKTVGILLVCFVVLLQTQSINNFSVKNQERFDYEDRLLSDVCDDLIKMDIRNKQVCFYAPEDYKLPSAFQLHPSANPIAVGFRKAVYAAWDRFIPSAFMGFLNRYISYFGPYEKAEDCLRLRQVISSPESPYLSMLGMKGMAYRLQKETLLRKGLDLDIVLDNKEYHDEFSKQYYSNTVFEKGERYRIEETDDMIQVFFISPDF